MAGQGSPRASRRWFASWSRRGLPATCIACIAVILSAGSSAAELDVRLRVAWGGGAERTWTGTISVDRGALADMRPLGIEADEPGSIWSDRRTIYIRQPSLRSYDGVDVLVTAPADAALTIELSSRDGAAHVKTARVKLADLVTGEHRSELDDQGNWLLVQRAAGDLLRVRMNRDSLVFLPGEELRLDVIPHRMGLPDGTALKIETQLRPARTTKELWTREELITLDEKTPPTIAVNEKLPDEEGVYDLVIWASRRNTLRLWQTVVTRRVQVVVLDRRAPDPTDQGKAKPPTAVISEVDPANARWWARIAKVPQLVQLPGLPKEPPSNGIATKLDHPALGRLIQLAPSTNAAGISWKAYPMPVDSPGQPHVLEVDFPTGSPQMLGVSILEPNAAGEVTPIGLDTSVWQDGSPQGGKSGLAKHRVVFWPRTKAPVVLVVNQSDTLPAVYGKIRVLGPQSAKGAFGLAKSATGYLPPAFPQGAPRSERLLAGYYDKPLFAENFSATEALDAVSGRSLDDWLTFYQGGERLIQYLHHAGYNGLMLSAFTDGGTLYPSALLEPTPKHDTGVFFSTGQDPVKKDVLELLLRQFDRDSLVLIPALQFSTPLPELEALLRRGDVDPTGIELVDGTGTTWRKRHGSVGGQAPYYNPLNHRVQTAIKAVVRELANRYAGHPSLGGVALRLSTSDYVQLPGATWGLDDVTFAEFERDAQVNLQAEGDDRFALREKFVSTGRGRQQWLSWRAEKINAFYRELQQEIAHARPRAKLFLAGGDMFASPELRRALAATLPARIRPDEAFLEVGIDLDLYRGQTDVVLIRPQWIAADGSAASRALDRRVSDSPATNRRFARLSIPASLVQHQPRRMRLSSFDEKSPFGAEKTYTWLVAQPAAAGGAYRRELVRSLAQLDAVALFQGGWMMPLGQESSLEPFISVYRRLPAAAFRPLPAASQPVTIRTHSAGGRTLAYLVNDSPWDVKLTLEVRGPADCRVTGIGARRLPPLVAGSPASWTVELAPYDLIGADFSSEEVELTAPRVTLSSDVEESMSEQIDRLVRRMAILRSPTAIRLLANGSFEDADDDGRAAGWQVAGETVSAPQLHATHPRTGRRHVRLVAGGTGAALVSRSFEPPQVGQLWLSVWLRIDAAAVQPQVRLGLEGTVEGRHYHRFADLGPARDIKPIGDSWGQYILKLDDLPRNGRGPMRVRIDLPGRGHVEIDDVQLYYVISEPQRRALLKIVALADQNLKDRRYTDCADALVGYWPRLLEEAIPLSTPPVARREKPDTPAKDPGILDRFVPGFLR